MQIIDVILFGLTVSDANPEPKGFQPWKRLKILEEVKVLFWIKNMKVSFQLSDYINRLRFKAVQNGSNL